jgi:hypothetical protein
VLGPEVGVFSCGTAGGGRIRANPAGGVELHVTGDERGSDCPQRIVGRGSERGRQVERAGCGPL